MEPRVILVDLLDNPIGEIEKSAAHLSPLLHRAFSVFLYNGNKMLLQRRAKGKYHSGGLWANACCSHPRPCAGDGDKLLACASARLLEETGIEHHNLKSLFTFTYFTRFADNLFEYELDHVLLGEYGGPFRPNPEEAEEMRWEEIPALLDDMRANPENYASWFLISAPKVAEALRRFWESDRENRRTCS